MRVCRRPGKKEEEQQSSLKMAVEDRRAHIRAVVAVIAPDLTDPEDAFFIDAKWFTKWANAPPSEEMPPISNGELECEHGGLNPLAWDSAKRISGAAWSMLHRRWGGGPQLHQSELCVRCTHTQLEKIVGKCVLSYVWGIILEYSVKESILCILVAVMFLLPIYRSSTENWAA